MTSAEPLSIAQHAAKKNLAAYINKAKKNIPFTDVSWVKNSWNITSFNPKRGLGKKKTVIHFFSRHTDDRYATGIPMHIQFIDSAKAIFSETMRIKKLKNPFRILYGLRYIEKALIDQDLEPCITNLTNDVLDRLVTLAEQDLHRPWDILNCVKSLVDTIEDKRLSIESLNWVNPIPFGNPPRNDRTSQNHDKTIRLPSIQAICELGSIHNESTAVNDKVTTSFVALTMFAPSRACEILTLPVNCITSGDSREGPVMGIAWYPAKGGLPLTKYAVSDESEELARDAISYLTTLGKNARIAAKWYRENPGKLYLPESFEHLRNLPLTIREASLILGRKCDIQANSARKYGLIVTNTTTRDPARVRKNGRRTPLYSFEGLEQWVISHFPVSFPILDHETKLYWDEALFVLPRNSLRPNAAISYNVPDCFDTTAFNNQLGGFTTNSIFKRNQKFDHSGVPYRITTHQFRHLLNTLAESKFLSQELIAFWSGRKSTGQNEWYNHLPQEAYIEAYVKLGEEGPDLEVYGPLVEKANSVAQNNAISYEDAMKIELGSIQATEYGLCRHHLALTPCPKDKNCSGCGEFAFIKGDEKSLKSATVQLSIFKNAVAQCLKGVVDNLPGAARWLAFNQNKLNRWQLIVDAHDDDSIPDKTLISLPPPPNGQSKTALSMQAEKLNTSPPSIEAEDESDGKLLDDLDFF